LIICLNNYNKKYFFKIFIRKLKISNIICLKKKIGKIFYLIKQKNRINYRNKLMIYTFCYGFSIKNLNLINILIKKMLERKKIHKKIIRNINNMLIIFFNIFNNVIGYKLQIKGRLDGRRRKRKLIFQKGKIPLNTFKSKIKYNFNEFKTPSGICSIKLWILFK
jgi:hypothetical protein